MTNKSLLNRFQGFPDGRRRLVEALRSQALVCDQDLAVEIAGHVTLAEIPTGATVITQGASDSDLFLILSGEFSISVDGVAVARRRAGEYVGEMSVVDPGALRSASVTAECESVVARITAPRFSALADRFPRLWRRIAVEFASRLRQGNAKRRSNRETDRAA